jgi:hypothetical protein
VIAYLSARLPFLRNRFDLFTCSFGYETMAEGNAFRYDGHGRDRDIEKGIGERVAGLVNGSRAPIKVCH